MGKRTVLALLAFVALGLCAQERRWVGLSSDTPAPPALQVLEEGAGRIVVQMDLPGYYEEAVSDGGATYTLITLPDSPNFEVQGSPALPYLTGNLAIGDDARMVLARVDTVSREVASTTYLPSKGVVYRNEDPAKKPLVFGVSYQTDAYFPESAAELLQPFILRNVRGIPVRFCPLAYNPVRGTLRVCERVTVEVAAAGKDDVNVLEPCMKVEESQEFISSYLKRFLNPPRQAEYTPVGEVGRLLIIAYDDFYDAMLPFYYWRLQKGIPTTMVKVSTAGATAQNIKNYISNQYQTLGLTYVLLVGDYQQVPFPTGTAGNVAGNASDPSYGLISGSDNYFELFVSRFSAQTVADVQVQVNRVLKYEKTPDATGEWYHKAFGIGGDSSGEGYTDWERMDMLYNVLHTPSYHYTVFDKIYHDPGNPADVTASVNNGRGIGLYIGHGGETSWSTTGYDTSDVASLNNGAQYPFIVSVACVNGHFNWSTTEDCFAERWLKVGTPEAPRGAIAFYGSSTNQSWVPPCVGQREIVDLLKAETFHTVGALFMNGCMKAVDVYPGTGDSSGAELCQSWHIFGDASTAVFSDTPTALTVSHNGMLPVGQATYQVTVTGVSGALCSLYNEATHTNYGTAYTNTSGVATITMATPPGAPMTLALTVTAFNRMPFFGTVQVVTPSGPYLSYLSYGLNDSTEGNGDGVLNPGEGGRLSVTVSNIGAEAGTGLTGTLTSTDAYVTVTDGAAVFPDIAKDGTGTTSPDHFAFTLASGAPNGHLAAFTLNWTAAGGNSGAMGFTVPVCAPLVISGVTVTELLPTSARVTWTTNQPSSSKVRYGTAVPPGQVSEDAAPVTSHSVLLTGLSSCTTYSFSVESANAGCYTAASPTGGYSTFRTKMAGYALGPDDVEGGAGGWVASGTGSGWHVDTCKSHSGTHAWKAGDAGCPGSYAAGTAAYLTSPPMALGPVGHGAQLKFWHWYQLADRGDACTVLVSTDGGGSWTSLEYWKGAGSSSGWVQKVYELSAYGGTVLIRFRLVSDASGVGEGWYLDDIEVGSAASCAPDEVGGTPEAAVRWTGGGKDGLSWGACAEAAHHHVYRGIPAALPDLLTAGPDSCLKADNVTGTSCTGLGEEPAAGAFFWFLVTGVNAAGLEGSAGTATAGLRDLDSTGGCP